MNLIRIKERKHLLMVLFLAISLFTFGEDINLTGTVTSSAGGAISGATVTLVNQNISVITNASGVYSIVKMNASAIQELDAQNQLRFSLSGSKLSFNLTYNQQVNIALYNTNGQLVNAVANQFLPAGDHEFSLGIESGDFNVYILKFATENSTRVYKLSGKNLQSLGANNSASLKSAPVVDNLAFSASGHTSKSVALVGYVGTLDVELTTSAPPVDTSNIMHTNRQLNKGEYLTSLNDLYSFGMNTSGDLVLMKGASELWSAGTGGVGEYARLQGDGNFLVKDGVNPTSIWKTNTPGNTEAVLILDDEGTVTLYASEGGAVLWSISDPGNPNQDLCPDDPNKTEPGDCGCGVPEGTCTSDCGADGIPTGGKLLVGPLVGHTTNTSSKIWAQAASGAKVEIKYYPFTNCSNAVVKTMTTIGRKNFSIVEITGLTANTKYEYLILVDGKLATTRSFTTAPTPNQPVEFRYVFGSGVKEDITSQPAWADILNLNVDFMVFGGDNVYPNSTNYDVIWADHKSQRTRTTHKYAEAISKIPTWAVWDDHDFGDNDSGGDEPGKENSLECFKDIWANDYYGTSSVDGIFSTFMWGDVEVYLLDCRYYQIAGKAYFGDGQMNWLKDKLKNSTATFKILVHGGTIRRSGIESWDGNDRAELDSFLDFIKDNHITGVIMNGGDVHQLIHNHFPKDPNGGSYHYDIFEIISSKWTYNENRYAYIDVNTKLAKPTMTYTFLEDGKTVQKGVYTLQDNGSMRHDYISGENYNQESSSAEPDPAYAFPE